MDEHGQISMVGEASDERERAIGNGIVSLVTLVFAPLMALLVPGRSPGFAGLILIIGGCIAVGLGVTAAADAKKSELATTLGVWGVIFAVIEIVVGISLIA